MKLELSNRKILKKRFYEVQSIIGISLPEQLYILLKNNDGAYPEPNAFRYFNEDFQESMIGSISSFLPINVNEYSDIVSMYKSPPEFFPKGIIAIGEDGGGDYICFDYREGKDNPNPSVVIWNHEAGVGKDVSFVAKDFETFIGMLKSEDEL